jgi:MFS family permease
MTTNFFDNISQRRAALLIAFEGRFKKVGSTSTHEKDTPRVGSRSLFRHFDFLRLWSAETFSVFGVQFSGLAIPWIAAKILKADTFAVGVLGALSTLPFLVFGLFVGVWADRNRRRPIMIMSDIGRAVALATIPITALLFGPSMIVLYVVSFSVGTLTVFDDVSSYAYLPSLVDSDQLVEANSRMETSRASAQVAGPSLAGVLIQLVTAPIAVILDVVGYLGSAGFLSMIRKEEPQVKQKADASVVKDVKEGLTVVFGNRSLWSIAGATGTSNFFSSALFPPYLLFVVQELGLSSPVLGLVFTLGAVGALVGALSANMVAKRLGVGRTIVISIFVGGISWIAVYFASPSFNLPLLILASFLAYMGSVIYNVNQVSFRQANRPA